jgi:hypothetical protein
MTLQSQKDSVLMHIGEALVAATRSMTREPLPPLMLALLRMLQQKERPRQRRGRGLRRHPRDMH